MLDRMMIRSFVPLRMCICELAINIMTNERSGYKQPVHYLIAGIP